MIIGLAILLAGMLIRLISILTLRKHFTTHLTTPTAVIKTGIYKRVRHPSYVGSMLMILGVSLINVVASILYISFMFFLSRVKEEEKYLMGNNEYAEYTKNTGMFIPKIRRVG